jgi:hypothetical protein
MQVVTTSKMPFPRSHFYLSFLLAITHQSLATCSSLSVDESLFSESPPHHVPPSPSHHSGGSPHLNMSGIDTRQINETKRDRREKKWHLDLRVKAPYQGPCIACDAKLHKAGSKRKAS